MAILLARTEDTHDAPDRQMNRQSLRNESLSNLPTNSANTYHSLADTHLLTLDAAGRVFEGELTEEGACGEAQRTYKETRQSLVEYLQKETGLTSLATFRNILNIKLETMNNFQHAVASTAQHYNVELKGLNEHLKRLARNPEEMEWHWKRCQNGYVRCRNETRKMTQAMITSETGC